MFLASAAWVVTLELCCEGVDAVICSSGGNGGVAGSVGSVVVVAMGVAHGAAVVGRSSLLASVGRVACY